MVRGVTNDNDGLSLRNMSCYSPRKDTPEMARFTQTHDTTIHQNNRLHVPRTLRAYNMRSPDDTVPKRWGDRAEIDHDPCLGETFGQKNKNT